SKTCSSLEMFSYQPGFLFSDGSTPSFGTRRTRKSFMTDRLVGGCYKLFRGLCSDACGCSSLRPSTANGATAGAKNVMLILRYQQMTQAFGSIVNSARTLARAGTIERGRIAHAA